VKTYDYRHETDDGVVVSIHAAELRRYTLRWSDDYTMLLQLNGSSVLYIQGKKYEMQAGDVAVINPDETYVTTSESAGNYMLYVYMNYRLFERYSKDNEYRLSFAVKNHVGKGDDQRYLNIRAVMARMMIAGLKEDPIRRLKFSAYIRILVAELLEKIACTWVQKPDENILLTFSKMLEYIDENCRDLISLEDVAKVGNYNPSYVSKLFASKAGVNFHEYITRARMQHALSDIKYTSKSLIQIAADSGFSSPKAFNRSFKKIFGESPSEYRKRMLAGDFAYLSLQGPPKIVLGHGDGWGTLPISNEVDIWLNTWANSSTFEIDRKLD